MRYDFATLLSRRQALKLATASVLLVTGCATFRQGSDLDAAMSDLDGLLDQMAGNGEQVWLASIARRIKIRAQDLVAEHREFVDSFDRLLREYSVTEVQLNQFIKAYARRRKWLRNDLLRLQDELHASLTPDEWAEVVQVLNRTGKAVATHPLSEV
jgi:hypothetical protein